MRKADGFLLVFSLTSRVSFLEVPAMYSQCLRVKDVDKFPVVLAGNKSDLFDKFQVCKLFACFKVPRLLPKSATIWQTP